MPELPEVETTLRGIKPHVQDRTVIKVTVRHHQLRWPIPRDLNQCLLGARVEDITRRAKYLLFHTTSGTLLIHLGMSGHLHLLTGYIRPKKHDHVDIELDNHQIIRFTDPRRFGAILWTIESPEHHSILKNLGVEPLDRNFSAHYLWESAQHRKVPIKSLIMDNKVVVGIGNIYAAESLFLARINPNQPAYAVSKEQCVDLVRVIKRVLRKAIQQGGTSLKDFLNSEGKPGYFSQYLQVYGRQRLPCYSCGTCLSSVKIGQRSTVYCPNCQKETK